MTETVIAEKSRLCTIINVFNVTPEKQQALIDALIEITDRVACKLPGFISANIHKSVDSERVVNYVQWRSREDLEAMLRLPEAKEHIAVCQQLASQIDFHLYTVEHIQGPA